MDHGFSYWRPSFGSLFRKAMVFSSSTTHSFKSGYQVWLQGSVMDNAVGQGAYLWKLVVVKALFVYSSTKMESYWKGMLDETLSKVVFRSGNRSTVEYLWPFLHSHTSGELAFSLLRPVISMNRPLLVSIHLASMMLCPCPLSRCRAHGLMSSRYSRLMFAPPAV